MTFAIAMSARFYKAAIMKTRSLLFAILCTGFTLFQIPIASPVVAQDEKEEKKETTPYAYTNAEGKAYYLFSCEQKVRNSDKTFTMYYFAFDPKNKKGKPLYQVPDDRKVSETKNGLPVLKKKK